MMHDHTKLRAFELADEVDVLVYRVTARCLRKELYGLQKRLGFLSNEDSSLIASIISGNQEGFEWLNSIVAR